MAATESPSLLWCEDCKEALPGDCRVHGPLLHIEDRPASPRAVKTAPRLIEILPIIPEDHDAPAEAGVGAFAACNIPPRTCFGPFEAPTVAHRPDVRGHSRLLLKRFRSRKECGWLDTVASDHACNWLIYVRPARRRPQINVIAFLYMDQIYFCTSQMIVEQNELRVWYSDDYAQLMDAQPLPESMEEAWIQSLSLTGAQRNELASPRDDFPDDDPAPRRRKGRRPQKVPQPSPAVPSSSAEPVEFECLDLTMETAAVRLNGHERLVSTQSTVIVAQAEQPEAEERFEQPVLVGPFQIPLFGRDSLLWSTAARSGSNEWSAGPEPEEPLSSVSTEKYSPPGGAFGLGEDSVSCSALK